MSASREALLRRFELELPDDIGDEDLRVLGFADPARLKQGLQRLRTRVDIARVFEVRFADILRALTGACDADQAFMGLERWLEAGGAAAGESALDWTDDVFLANLCTLFAGTPALSEYFIRFPQRTRPVLKPVVEHSMQGGRAWQQHVHASVAEATGFQDQLSSLRRARTEAMLQIAALDLSGVSKLEDTIRACSDLADACIQTALDIAVDRLKQRFGQTVPRENAKSLLPDIPLQPPFCVLGMGKLGGRELNYSSDIDLVFIFEGEATTQGLGRNIPYRDYFTQIGQEIIAILDQVTEDGRVYRVDMRLRPYGSTGALVKTAAETLAYLQSEGRTWERQAWLKARACAGDVDLGRQMLEGAEAFVHRRYLSLDAIGDIQALKKQMEIGVAKRGETDDEVKLGRGGIRDIEFTVQFLQLLHGGQNKTIRGGHTLQALQKLRSEGLLTATETERLDAAYEFWRHVEHRLQLHGNLQTHKLPVDSVVRRRIARSMNYQDVPAQGDQPAVSAAATFEAERLRHVTRVREIFEGLFANLFREHDGPHGQLSDMLLAPDPDLAALAKLLPQFGFEEEEKTARELVSLRRERIVLSNPSRTRKFFASLAPMLLRALAVTGDPEGALARFSRLAHSLGGKAVLYQSLNENPWLLRVVCDLAAWSEFLTSTLVANPGLFDELLDALGTDRSKSVEQMDAELKRVTGGGDIGATLRAYKSAELLRIGVRDLIQSAPAEQTRSEVTDLAQAILRAQLRDVLVHFKEKRGVVTDEAGKEVGFAIIGLGKFGGREMNYGSDLDILFFYGSEGQTADGMPAGNYFAMLAQELTRKTAEHTALGPLYQLDPRLRPNGNKGPLAVSPDAFEKYWKSGELADWERLALTRARFLAGDPGVGERAEHLIRSACYSPLQSTDLAEKVREMRAKIESHAKKDDLKGGRGGIIDIEFLVQYLQLVHGVVMPPLRQTNTRASLEMLIKKKVIKGHDGKQLVAAFEFFSLLGNRVRVMHGLSAHSLPQDPVGLQRLALRAGFFNSPQRTAGEALKEDFTKYADAAREIFEKLVK